MVRPVFYPAMRRSRNLIGASRRSGKGPLCEHSMRVYPGGSA
jgi:hypothetical protein